MLGLVCVDFAVIVVLLFSFHFFSRASAFVNRRRSSDLKPATTVPDAASPFESLVPREETTNLSLSNAISTLFVTSKIKSSNPAGSPGNGNNRRGGRLPFQPPACTHRRPSGRRS